MPQIQDYVVEVTTEVTIRTDSGRIVEEFSSTDSVAATTYPGVSLKGRTEVLLARTGARVMDHVKLAEVHEKSRLSSVD